MKLKPENPGKILKQKLVESNISVIELSKHIGIGASYLYYIVAAKRVTGTNKQLYDVKIKEKLALKLADALKTTPEFWLELQMKYNLWEAAKLHKKLKPIKLKK